MANSTETLSQTNPYSISSSNSQNKFISNKLFQYSFILIILVYLKLRKPKPWYDLLLSNKREKYPRGLKISSISGLSIAKTMFVVKNKNTKKSPSMKKEHSKNSKAKLYGKCFHIWNRIFRNVLFTRSPSQNTSTCQKHCIRSFSFLKIYDVVRVHAIKIRKQNRKIDIELLSIFGNRTDVL